MARQGVRPAAQQTTTDERTVTMLQRAHAMRGARRTTLENEAISLNLPMARRLSRRYRGRGVADDDLEQVASLAMVKAVRRFDPDRGAFASYAVPTITGELRRYFRDHARVVRPGRAIQENQARATAARHRLRAELHHEPSSSEVAAEADMSAAALRAADSAAGAYAPRSLDGPMAGSASTTALGELLGAEDPALARQERVLAVATTLGQLPVRDRQLLGMRYVEDRTQQDIAGELGISQMQVSRRLARIISSVRQTMGLD